MSQKVWVLGPSEFLTNYMSLDNDSSASVTWCNRFVVTRSWGSLPARGSCLLTASPVNSRPALCSHTHTRACTELLPGHSIPCATSILSIWSQRKYQHLLGAFVEFLNLGPPASSGYAHNVPTPSYVLDVVVAVASPDWAQLMGRGLPPCPQP